MRRVVVAVEANYKKKKALGMVTVEFGVGFPGHLRPRIPIGSSTTIQVTYIHGLAIKAVSQGGYSTS
jgi:hypothetical protein